MYKNKYVRFRVSENDKKEIIRLADVLGYSSVSDYLYSISLSGISIKDYFLIFNQVHDMRMKNVRVENNINQLAKYVNTYKQISESQFDEYIILLKEFTIIRKEQTKSIYLLLDSIRDDKKKLYEMLNKEKNDQN